jgi:WD40 repeat protein
MNISRTGLIIVFCFIIGIASSCSGAPKGTETSTLLLTPDSSSTPILSPSLSPSPTPTLEPALSLPVTNGTVYPGSSRKLDSESINKISQIGHYGTPAYSYYVVSADRSRMYVVASDGLRIYQLPGFELFKQTKDYIGFDQQISQLGISANGERYAFIADKIFVKDVNGKTLLEIELPFSPSSSQYGFSNTIVISPNGKTLLVLSPGEENWTTVWSIYDIDSGTKLEKSLNTQTNRVVFSPDGEKLLAYEQYTGYFASYLTSDWTYEFSTAFEKNFEQLTISPDHSRVAIIVNGLLRIYDFDGMTIVREIKLDKTKYVRILAFSADSSKLAYTEQSPSGDHTVSIDIKSGSAETKDGLGYFGFNTNGELAANDFFFQPENLGLMSYYDIGNSRAVFTDQGFTIQYPNNDPVVLYNNDDCFPVAISADGSHIVCSSTKSGNFYYLYNVSTDQNLVNWERSGIQEVIFSNDGKYVAITFYINSELDSDHISFVLYDLKNDLPILQKENKYDQVNNRFFLEGPLAYSPDSTMLVYMVIKQGVRNDYDLTFQFLSADKGQKTTAITIHNFPKEDGTYETRIAVSSLAISPDNSMLAVGTEDGMVTIIDIAGQKVVSTWQAQNYAVSQIMFSPDQTTLATYGTDGFLNIWAIYQ